MKNLLLLLLVATSFRVFSQDAVKIESIGLEVMKFDLGEMNWFNAENACAKLGGGWRLPTLEELKRINEKRHDIGGFEIGTYWSSSKDYTNYAWTVYFSTGFTTTAYMYDAINNVRAVRSIK